MGYMATWLLSESSHRMRRQFAYHIEQIPHVKRFDDHVVYTQGDCIGAGNDRGNDNNGGEGMGSSPLSTQPFQECASIHDRHGQIKENHIRVASLTSGIIHPG